MTGVALLLFASAFGLWRALGTSGVAANQDFIFADEIQRAVFQLREDLRTSEAFIITSDTLHLTTIRAEASGLPSVASLTWTWDASGLTRRTTDQRRRFGPGSSDARNYRLEVSLAPAASDTIDLVLGFHSALGKELVQVREKTTIGYLAHRITAGQNSGKDSTP